MRAAMVPLRHTSPAAPCLSLAQSLEYAHTVPHVSIAAHSTYRDALDSTRVAGHSPGHSARRHTTEQNRISRTTHPT
jgi:hypothetical protein